METFIEENFFGLGEYLFGHPNGLVFNGFQLGSSLAIQVAIVR